MQLAAPLGADDHLLAVAAWCEACAPVHAAAMKRAKKHVLPPKPRNPVARSPLLRKGGAHGKTTAAKRRQAKIELARTPLDDV